LNHEFDLAAKVEKKIKEAWDNKWVRYSVGTALVLIGLATTLKVLEVIHEARQSQLAVKKFQDFLSER